MATIVKINPYCIKCAKIAWGIDKTTNECYCIECTYEELIDRAHKEAEEMKKK